MKRFDDLPLDETVTLMQRLMPAVKSGERVMFLCDPGSGNRVVQRIRVMMSRARKKLKKQKKRLIHFKLHHSVHPHTENGIRYDAVVLWSSRSQSHIHQEMLEDILTNG